MNLAGQTRTPQLPLAMATSFLTKKTVVTDPPEPALNLPPNVQPKGAGEVSESDRTCWIPLKSPAGAASAGSRSSRPPS